LVFILLKSDIQVISSQFTKKSFSIVFFIMKIIYRKTGHKFTLKAETFFHKAFVQFSVLNFELTIVNLNNRRNKNYFENFSKDYF
jgi:hypothetical protein